MLSVQPLKSAQSAVDYYTKAYEYYKNDASAMVWQGEGSKILGLHNKDVDKETMLRLLKGELPTGEKLGIVKNGELKHRPGFDMTFSAPKSVSILWGLGADNELEKLHDKAVSLAIKDIEAEFAQTRIVQNGEVEFVDTHNLTFATFRQPTSRADDPDIHTHCVGMNLTFDSNNKARSLASDMSARRGVVEQLQKNVIYCGLIYRHYLAGFLKERGYKLEVKEKGLFEIKDLPENVLQNFSKRREQILEFLNDKGWSGSKASSIANQVTRQNKTSTPINDLKERWRDEAASLNFNPIIFCKNHLSNKISSFSDLKEKIYDNFFNKEQNIARLVNDVIDISVAKITKREAVFSLRSLKSAVMEHLLVIGKSIPISDINKNISLKIKEGVILSETCPLTKQQILSTPWMLTLESESLAIIERNRESVRPISSKKSVSNYIEKFESSSFQMTATQKKAIHFALESKSRFLAIQGYAGTGKTTILKNIKKISDEKGYILRGLTVQGTAANELSTKGEIKADVYDLVLGEIKSSDKDLSRTIYIVDESSMLSSEQSHQLIKNIEQKNARAIFVGDKAQLPGVAAGKIFNLSQKYGIPTSELTDIIRQKDENLKEAVLHATRGEVYNATKKLTRVSENESYEDRVNIVASRWLNSPKSVREQTIIFAPTNKNREDITNIIRSGLLKEGVLSSSNQFTQDILKRKDLSKAHIFNAFYYKKGDVIRVNFNHKRSNIYRGEYFEIDGIDKTQKTRGIIPLIRENGRKVKLRLDEIPKYIKESSNPIEQYQKKKLSISEGEQILWTKNFKHENIRNSEKSIISKIFEDSILLNMQDGTQKSISKSNQVLKHLEHGYVLTNYKAQGKDATYGIGLLESFNQFSATIQNFYVEISRGVREMEIVTDDQEKLIKALDMNDSEKSSALESFSSKTLKAHADHFSSHPQSQNIDAIVKKKEQLERNEENEKSIINQYKLSKNEGNKYVSTQIAHKIVSDRALFKKALAILSYRPETYRNDAFLLERANYKKKLNPHETKDFELVSKYHSIENKINYSSKQINKDTENPNNTIKIEQINKLKAQRNQIAKTISSDINRFKEHLTFFSIGRANHFGLLQRNISKAEAEAEKKLEFLAKYALNIKENTSKQETKVASVNKGSFQSVRSIQKISGYHDIKMINDSLMSKPRETYTAIFGEPKSQSSSEIRFPGAIVVSLKGQGAGLWYDFHSDKGGGPIQAIMHTEGKSFKKALDDAAKLSRINPEKGISLRHLEREAKKHNVAERVKIAQSIYRACVPLPNTLGEKYLSEHRKIPNAHRLNIKYFPKGAQYEDLNKNGHFVQKQNHAPAIVLAAKNVKGEITGVQRVYLDEVTGSKSKSMKTPKLSKGITKGSACLIQPGKETAPVYIAEGPETAASIAAAKRNSTVICSFGVTNMKNISDLLSPYSKQKIIIAADNDGQNKAAIRSVKIAKSEFQSSGLDVKIVRPLEQGFDFNDVIQKGGIALVSQQLSLDERISENQISIESGIKDLEREI